MRGHKKGMLAFLLFLFYQYLPRLNPLMKATPLCQPGRARKVERGVSSWRGGGDHCNTGIVFGWGSLQHRDSVGVRITATLGCTGLAKKDFLV